MSKSSEDKESSNKIEPNENVEIVENKIIGKTGDIQIIRYSKGRFLGKGGYAECYEFTCMENKKVFAVKVIAKDSLKKSRAKSKLLSEIEIHKSLKHPHIVSFEYFFEDVEKVYIVLEMCHNQTLDELLKKRKRLTEIEVQCYIVQLIEALKYLHSQKVIHRDLKLRNIFLTDKMELKVGDFGLATKLDFQWEKRRTICGTPNYIAPEVLEGERGYSFEVDIWSLGVIIYELIIGEHPFKARNEKAIFKRIKMNSFSFPETAIISEAAKDLISQILVTDSLKRPSLDEILSHDFFNQGTSIPKLLPTFTLERAPSLFYIRKFMPDAGKNGIVNKPLTSTKLREIGGSNNKNNDKTPDVQNLKGPDTWVIKYLDYSKKFGLGYLLSNGFYGVFFNDSTKIILNTNTNKFNYIEKRTSDKQDYIYIYSLNDYPKELEKKVILLQRFKDYFQGENNNNDEQNITNMDYNDGENKDEDKCKDKVEEKEKEIRPSTYVKGWRITRHAIIFFLSNKFVQFCFNDKSEIILSSLNFIIYVNKKGERTTHAVNTIKQMQMLNYEIIKRFKFAKIVLIKILKKNEEGNVQKNQNYITEEQSINDNEEEIK